MNKFRFILIVGFVLSISWFGLIWNAPPKTISTTDPELRILVDAIHEFENDNQKPPEVLDELIPVYIDALKLPKHVASVDYVLERDSNSWELTFKDVCNFEVSIRSNNSGSLKFPATIPQESC